MLHLPPNGDDRALLQKAGIAVMDIQFAAEGKTGDDRDLEVIAALKVLEQKGLGA